MTAPVATRPVSGITAPPPPRLPAAAAAVYAGQLARARAGRGPLLFVAALQSVGVLVLLRAVAGAGHRAEGAQIVAGATVLVVAFVALNLLSQRFGMLKATGGLDYYGALPVPPAAVVLGTAAGYATFTVPGCLVTALVGIGLYHLPFAPLALLPVVLVVAGVSLAGVGALLGLALPKPELATVAGQLAMSAVIFLDLVPAAHLPVVIQGLRAAVPSTYAVDAFAGAFAAHPHWDAIGLRLAICVAVAVVSLALARTAFQRAVRR